ncbi:MAG: tetratricopeptide repeat protein [Bacteroidales bacterium]|nr:tetratricopeptide repeat protein [Bacteroidales bacterium]
MIAFGTLQWSCSTQKNSFVNRTYHTINAKYNGFFNARESYREGVKRLSELHNDNYEEILAVFKYGSEQDAASVRSNMDVAYEKASLVIRRHSMDIRGVEYNKWIDESYFLIARSHFFKRDYTLAILTFEYIIRQYDTRRSHDSKVWIAKSYHRQDRFTQAAQMLELLEDHYADGLLTEETAALFRLAYAEHYMLRGSYELAAEQLQKGMPYVKNRHDRVRLTFIQGQLYHHSGNFARAQQTYQDVLRMRPSFQMAFQSRIGMAMAYDPSVGGSGYIRNELLDMLSDDRNRLYRDQIYYALAQLAMRQNDVPEAIRLYTLSYEASEENNLQKALSFLRLGEIYFEKPDYVNAGTYYDSTINYLPASFENFEHIRRRQMVLSNLVQQLRVIEHEDSLQRLAALPKAEQEAVADAIIRQLREEDRRREQEERERVASMRDAGRMARDTRGMGGQETGWYFYNSTTIANGKLEFFSRFGDRRLEDMWRISNKQMLAGDFDMGFDFDNEYPEEEEEELDAYDRETYLRNIPVTEEQMAVSNQRKIQAWYNKALIFKDQLRDVSNAIHSFDAVINTFPGSPFELNAFYCLYYLYRESGDVMNADLVKNRLLAQYPDSEYAKIIGDPNYADKVRERQRLAEQLYKESYQAFFAGRYDVIRQNMRALDTLDVSRDIAARFAYLNALSFGRSDDPYLFRSELQSVVDNFGETPVHGPASILLASLDVPDSMDDLAADTGRDQRRRAPDETMDSPFTYSPDKVHFFIMIINTARNNPTDISNKLNEYNNEKFSGKDLTGSNIFFEQGKQLLTVTNFPNLEDAMDYYSAVMQSELFSQREIANIEAFVISIDNYPAFYQDKKLDDYRLFFDFYYLGI